jgi:hypothetical protein
MQFLDTFMAKPPGKYPSIQISDSPEVVMAAQVKKTTQFCVKETRKSLAEKTLMVHHDSFGQQTWLDVINGNPPAPHPAMAARYTDAQWWRDYNRMILQKLAVNVCHVMNRQHSDNWTLDDDDLYAGDFQAAVPDDHYIAECVNQDIDVDAPPAGIVLPRPRRWFMNGQVTTAVAGAVDDRYEDNEVYAFYRNRFYFARLLYCMPPDLVQAIHMLNNNWLEIRLRNSSWLSLLQDFVNVVSSNVFRRFETDIVVKFKRIRQDDALANAAWFAQPGQNAQPTAQQNAAAPAKGAKGGGKKGKKGGGGKKGGQQKGKGKGKKGKGGQQWI